MNESDQPLRDVTLTIRVDPEVALPLHALIERVDASSTSSLREEVIQMPLLGERLAQQAELERGSLIATLTQGERELARHQAPLSVYAFNEWLSGAGPLEHIAAFVTPNHADLAPLLAQLGERLSASLGSGALNGYPSRDPSRSLAMVEGAYAVLQACQLRYSNAPASFEVAGQKIRGVEQVLSGKLANSLELSVLLASMLEQIGLHALLFFERGHAFAGAWLVDQHLHRPISDDASFWRKHVDLGECVVFDAASLALGRSFGQAMQTAYEALIEPGRIESVVDLAAARQQGVKPLPHRSASPWTVVAQASPPLAPAQLPRPQDATRAQPAAASPSERAKLELWKAQLLDLSLRNKLLNFRESKQSIALSTRGLDRLEDALDGRPLTLCARFHGEGPQAEAEAEARALAQGRVFTTSSEAELATRTLEMFRLDRKLVEETGTSSLFLSLGMVQWLESASASTPRLAPILLLPVTLTRENIRGPYSIKRRDEDPFINETLLRKLAQDWGLVLNDFASGLPTDDAGLDVRAILDSFLRSIKALPGFDVIWRADLSFYQFHKFMMWQDLEARADALLSNEVVRFLVEGTSLKTAGEAWPSPERLDEQRHPKEDLSVVDADSSQLAAIFAALDGRTFVLQGPPGTGKSQTITNLIAQALARQKTVLFVSEKRAALEVVEQRLKQAGLGPFTLELHSEQATKTQAIRQLEEPFQLQMKHDPASWAQLAERLRQRRQQLNTYARLMHEPGPFGESPYQVIGALMRLEGLPRGIKLEWPLWPDRPAYERAIEALAALRDASARLEVSPDEHPWRDVQLDRWHPGIEAAFEDALELALDALRAWQDTRDRLVRDVFPQVQTSPLIFDRLGDVAQRLADCSALTAPLLGQDGALLEQRLEQLVAKLTAQRQRRQRLEAAFLPSLYTLDLASLRGVFERWAASFALLAWLMLWTKRRALRPHARGQLLPSAQLPEALAQAQQVVLDSAWLDDPTHEQVYGSLWRGEQTDPEALRQATHHAFALRRALELLRQADEHMAKALSRRLIEDPSLRESFRQLRDLEAQARRTLKAQSARLGLDPAQADQARLEASCAQLEGLAQRMDMARDWCDWRRASSAVQALGLDPLVHALRRRQLRPDQLVDMYDYSLRLAWWAHLAQRHEPLADFRGARHDELLRDFQRMDAQAKTLAVEEIRAKLAARLPAFDAPGSMELLRREFKKKSRHKPIRSLFAQAPEVMARLKPCVLMSPLSVARFLDPAGPAFDLIIFDEASQIPPWDAIGAIARGRQAVIVGDSKQLPPTSFFTAQTSDELVAEDDLIDMESILDHAVSRGMRQMTLNWHYRSRHPSLIAFSNERYYDHRLHIFPAAAHASDELGVKWIQVPEGIYDRGASRTNRAEAQRVVALLVERLLDPARSHRSIGVVTFSSAQQQLIEDLVDEQRQRLPALEPFFSADRAEPVFIKNLENVQGDERDVMIFSICYGPDQLGRIPMAFGPLNRQGGERRLNVAVTRARELLLVVSTLRADQIDLGRTSALGVEHLKVFLDYAARGSVALREAAHLDPHRSFDSPFERQVYDALTQRGWRVHTQVGVAGYRIDLAVVDPERPGMYLMGIECDGASYHSAKTARDRDRIRQSVLEGLGWTLHRIWSTEWWQRRSHEIDRLIEALAQRRRAAASPVEAPAQAAAQVIHAPSARPDPEAQASPAVSPAPDSPRVSAWPEDVQPWLEVEVDGSGDKKDFYMTNVNAVIESQIAKLLMQAQPMTLEGVVRRVSRSWGFTNVTSKQRDRLKALCELSPRVFIDARGDLWSSPQEASRWVGFRHHELASRSLDEIPQIELELAARWCIQRAIALPREKLGAELARVFGAPKGKPWSDAAASLIEHALSQGSLHERSSGLSLPTKDASLQS